MKITVVLVCKHYDLICCFTGLSQGCKLLDMPPPHHISNVLVEHVPPHIPTASLEVLTWLKFVLGVTQIDADWTVMQIGGSSALRSLTYT